MRSMKDTTTPIDIVKTRHRQGELVMRVIDFFLFGKVYVLQYWAVCVLGFPFSFLFTGGKFFSFFLRHDKEKRKRSMEFEQDYCREYSTFKILT